MDETHRFAGVTWSTAVRRDRAAGYPPDEGIWRYLKRVELRNVSCDDLDHLRRELRTSKERLPRKTHIIQVCIRQPGYV